MRSPNPSSFKNFSARRKRGLRPFLIFFLFLVGGAAAFFLFWENSASQIPAPVEEKSLPVVLPNPQAPVEDSYQEFDPLVEEEGDAPDMEATHEAASQEVDSELGALFKQQQQKGSVYFQESWGWKKNAHPPVKVPAGVPQVAVVIEGVGYLSASDWRILHKLKVPLAVVVFASSKGGATKAKASPGKGAEVFVQGALPKGQSLEKKFPQAVGVISAKDTKGMPENNSYLTLSLVKGLSGGVPHLVVSFPQDRSKKIGIKNQKVILWVTYKPGRLPALGEYISRLKKKATFVPVSQFYQEPPASIKKGTPINLQKIKEARPNLV
jgi:hypothetical protein